MRIYNHKKAFLFIHGEKSMSFGNQKKTNPNTNPTVHAFALITTFIRIPVYTSIRGICNRNKNKPSYWETAIVDAVQGDNKLAIVLKSKIFL